MLGIKQEAQPSNDRCSLNTNRERLSTHATFQPEKQKLIEAFSTLKAENQTMTFDLRKLRNENAEINSEKKELEQKLARMANKVDELQSDLNQARKHFDTQAADYEQTISNLSHDNQILSARMKQIQKSVSQNHIEKVETENESIYEFEQLLNDKYVRNVRYFLVRWSGFGPEHDTWERESNLLCPHILKNYLQNNK